MEYDAKSRKITPDQRNGQDRRIGFLGYPGNYGFIPSTLRPKKWG
ncbi:MAG: hypothetical protein CL868_18525 [Cytophagaceae bacterium]|nr:hypothetical protein [Cytophagaceae bacterium]